MWIAPPSGLRRMSAATTASVRCAVSSRTRADAALWPPLTARKALVTAIAIFEGSNATTAPLRRMTLYWASLGSVFTASGELASAAVGLCVGARDGAMAELATCMVLLLANLIVVDAKATRYGRGITTFTTVPALARDSRTFNPYDRCRPFGAHGAPSVFV